MGTIATIVKENADQILHQMQGIGHGRVDILKYLPIGNNWKRVMLMPMRYESLFLVLVASGDLPMDATLL